MNDDLPLDRKTRAWLELMPDEAPDSAIAAVLQAVATTPQVRSPLRRAFRRSSQMSRFTFAATAAAVAALVVGGLIWSTGPVSEVGQPVAPTPTAPAPSASSGEELPAALQRGWNGYPRDIPGLGASTRTRLVFTTRTFSVASDRYRAVVPSAASVVEPGQLRLETTLAGECEVGDVGTYRYALSPEGTRLTVEPGTDECRARAVAVEGTWYASNGCKVDPGGCLGVLEAGTYPSQFFDPRLGVGETWAPRFGAIQYTVPDGWANADDWPAVFRLTPQQDYALETADGPPPGVYRSIEILARPVAHQQGACSAAPEPGVGRSARELAEWVVDIPGIVDPDRPGELDTIEIDGRTAWAADIALAPAASASCAEAGPAVIPLLTDGAGGPDAWRWVIGGQERQRVIFLDLGDGDTVAIMIAATDGQRFEAFVGDAVRIVESLRFE